MLKKNLRLNGLIEKISKLSEWLEKKIKRLLNKLLKKNVNEKPSNLIEN